MTKLEMIGVPSGTLQMEQDGLFLKFTCVIQPVPEAPLRVYAVSGWHCEYLGIPCPQDGAATLEVRLPAAHFTQAPRYAIADPLPRGEWAPWCGTLDGVAMQQCYLRRQRSEIELALSPEEAQELPAWLSHMEEGTLFGARVYFLRLNGDGTPPFSTAESTEAASPVEEVEAAT